MAKLKNKNSAGFTLVELIIYIAIVGTVLVLITSFLWDIVLGNIKETAYREVQQNARFTMAKIIQETKKAAGVNTPSTGVTSDFLSLNMASSDLNPTVFDIDGGRLRIRRGADISYLTPENIKIVNLQFTNLSYVGESPTIRIEMTTEYNNSGNRQEYQASLDLKTTVNLFPGGAMAMAPRVEQLHYRWRNDDAGE